ncbi:MAG: LLM class flavin-dependent oxidoreductase [Chloroflexi bacterium]|nr:LLM class flavin-dependent oxidoreductase [Chloroflexota bacterium]
MKFGISVGSVVTKPWDKMSESRTFHEAVEIVELADQLGFDSAWSVEHHFLEEYSHMSAPDMFFAYCAARTKQIRFGHGIYLMLPNINHPARVAERIATLDILSNGRVELGTGRSATWTELGGFLVEPDDTKEMWEESTRSVVKMWTSDEFSIKGRHFSMPPRNVLPKPVQEPHPPIWVAVQSPETAVLAGEKGIGMLGVTLGGIPKYADLIADYRRASREAEPIGVTVNNKVRAQGGLFCHPDSDFAQKMAGKAEDQLAGPLSSYLMTMGSTYPSPAYHAHSLGSGAAFRPPLGADQVGKLVGNPDEVAKAVEDWQKLGVDALNIGITGRWSTHEQNLESMRLFAKEVMPAFLDEPVASEAAT